MRYHPPGTEGDIKARSLAAGRKLGYIIASTSDSRKNRTRDVADSYVSHPRWGNLHLAVDFKSKTGKLTPRQAELRDAGVLLICRSVEDFVAELMARLPPQGPPG